MEKDIKYSGFTASPSDYECPDGTLAASHNLVSEQGHIRPLPQPSVKFKITPGSSICKFNPESNLTHYIECTPLRGDEVGTAISILDDTGAVIESIRPVPDAINSVTTIGRMIILSGNNATYYLRWAADLDKYIYLGSKLPEVKLRFGLFGDIVSRDFDTKIDLVKPDDLAFVDEIDPTQICSVFFNKEPISKDPYSESDHSVVWSHDGYPGTKLIYPSNEINLQKGRRYRLDVTSPAPNMYLKIVMYSGQWPQVNMIFGFRPYKKKVNRIFVPNQDWPNVSFAALTISSYTMWEFAEFTGTVTLSVVEIEEDGAEDGGTETKKTGDDAKIIDYTSESYMAVTGALNKFIAEEATSKGRHIYPFFVKYALRLYDGTNSAVSPPVLMIPNSEYVPLIFYRDLSPSLTLRAFCAELRYFVESVDNLADWENVIDGIDIFISQPAWPYNQGKEFETDKYNFSYIPYSQCSTYGILSCATNGIYGESIQKLSLKSVIGDLFETESYQKHVVRAGAYSEKDFMANISSISNFYCIKSLDYDDLKVSEQFVGLELPDGSLTSLVAKPTIDDDILRYSGMISLIPHVYNSRVHHFGGSVILPPAPSVMDCNAATDQNRGNGMYAMVCLRCEDGVHCVTTQKPSLYCLDNYWYYYPDARAYKAILFEWHENEGISRYCELPLTAHDLLDGAYYIAESLSERMEFTLVEPTEDDGKTQDEIDRELLNRLVGRVVDDFNAWAVNAGSTVYVSDSGNPFVFRASKIVSIGDSRIIALSSAARALSQGQFGQFPLYAFTDQGVWALETSQTGTYTARQPITRDVCLSPQAITQIDSAVLFASARGIMLLSGSQTSCISDAVNSDSPFNIMTLPAMDKLHAILGHGADSCVPVRAFQSFISEARMLYDYTHQRIILYNASGEYDYAYVFSLESKSWGMMRSTLRANVNSYPEALAIDSYGNLVDFSRDGAFEPQLLVTRPLKLEIPDILKTIDTVIQRGNFRKGHVQSVLYGSRDLYNWHLVWSSRDHYLRGFRGTPYKYYRIALVCNLQADESIFGASLQFTPRQTNQPR